MQFSKHILKSGLRVITVPMVGNPSVTVLVLVEAGSKYEDANNNGISHFLEHTVFKGTPMRPNPTDISRELESLGASHNAFTSREYTGYYAKAAAKHADKILDIVADMYVNPVFDSKELEKEKGVIVEEIRMHNDYPRHKAYRLLMDLLYHGQPAGFEIAGTEENVRSFNRDMVLKYRAQHYVAASTIVVIAGSFDENKMLSSVESAFSKVPVSNKHPKLPTKDVQDKPRMVSFYKDIDQTNLAFAVRTFSLFDPRMPVKRILSVVLGKGMSSRLWVKMREELGVCYYAHSSYDSFTDHGYLGINAGVDNARIGEAVKGILAECARLTRELVSSEELSKAKEMIASSFLLGLETSDDLADFVGDQEVLKGKIETPEEKLAKIMAVTAEEVRTLAREIFVDKGLNLAVVSRVKDLSSIEPLLTFL